MKPPAQWNFQGSELESELGLVGPEAWGFFSPFISLIYCYNLPFTKGFVHEGSLLRA